VSGSVAACCARAGEPPSGQLQWLRAGWFIDGRGGAILTDQLIGLRNGRIETILPAREGCPATALDFSAATVLPALIDAHVHLALAADAEGCDPTHRMEVIDRHLWQNWRAGVLAVRDAGDCHGAVLAYKRQRPGAGPRVHIAAAGWGWHAPGRYGRLIARTCAPGESLFQVVGRQVDADHLKIIQSGINSLDCFGRPTPGQFGLTELQAAVQAAHALGRPVMVHANGDAPVAAALAAGCDSIEHGYFMGPANLEQMAARQTFWVPTVIPMAALAGSSALTAAQRDVASRTVDHQLSQIATGHKLGIPIAAGTDAGSPGVAQGASLRQELALLVSAGLTLPAAVACATYQAARLLRKERQGALLRGWRADLIVVAGEPARLLQTHEVTAIHAGGHWWPVDPDDARGGAGVAGSL
jgi:imidazolonepropionase-like amidohydrolase